MRKLLTKGSKCADLQTITVGAINSYEAYLCEGKIVSFKPQQTLKRSGNKPPNFILKDDMLPRVSGDDRCSYIDLHPCGQVTVVFDNVACIYARKENGVYSLLYSVENLTAGPAGVAVTGGLTKQDVWACLQEWEDKKSGSVIDGSENPDSVIDDAEAPEPIN